MSYTTCRIGGVDMWVDPDNISPNHRIIAQIEPAIDGTKFMHYLQSNPYNPATDTDVSVSGIYITETAVSTLQSLLASHTLVKIEGVPGISGADDFVIVSLSHNPIKPAVIFPGDDPVNPPIRFTYNINLIRVS